MRKLVVLIALLLKFSCVENRLLSVNYAATIPANGDEESETTIDVNESIPNEKIVGFKNLGDNDPDEYAINYGKEIKEKKKPCAIVVLSNMQSPSIQSLLRKYRYDANGVLIPSSVKYFIKLPQGLRSSPLLVPLNDKAFSPLGGFVRYYKEVPPIPHSW